MALDWNLYWPDSNDYCSLVQLLYQKTNTKNLNIVRLVIWDESNCVQHLIQNESFGIRRKSNCDFHRFNRNSRGIYLLVTTARMNIKLFSLTNSFEKVRRNVRSKDDMMASCGDRFRNKNKIFHQYIASMLIKSYQLETRCILVMDIGVAQQRWNGATAEKLENKTNSRNRCCVSVHRAYMFSTCPVNVCERFYLVFFPRSVEWKLVFADNIATDDVCV